MQFDLWPCQKDIVSVLLPVSAGFYCRTKNLVKFTFHVRAESDISITLRGYVFVDLSSVVTLAEPRNNF